MNSPNSTDLQALQALWQDQENRLQQQWQATQTLFQSHRMDQTQSLVSGIIRRRIFETVIWGLILIGLGQYIFTHLTLPAPAISAGILFVFSLVGMIGVVSEWARLHRIRYDAPVLELQAQLEAIRAHRLRFFQLSLASFPFFLAHIFFWTELLFGFDLYPVADLTWLLSNVILSILFVPPLVWLLRQFSPHYPQRRKWVQRLAAQIGGRQLARALDQLERIQAFEQENVPG